MLVTLVSLLEFALSGKEYYPLLMKTLLLTLTVIGLAASAFALDFPKGSPKFETTLDSALTAAKTSGKPVLLIFSSADCPPCEIMKKKVFPSKAVRDLHDAVVWTYINVDEPSNTKIAEKYGAEMWPHMELVSSTGKSLVKGSPRIEDYIEPRRFAKWLSDGLASVTSKASSAE